MFDLLRASRAAPTDEAMYQSHLFTALSLPIVHLVRDTASFASLESGYDLDMVRVRDSPTYEETSVYLKLMDWTAEGRGIAVSDVSAKLGVRQPDISTCVFLELEGETYNLVSMILEIKPSPGNQENAQTAIGQMILYLIAAYECCGCWLGVAFHAGRFVRAIADDARTIYFEVSGIRNGGEIEEISVADLLNREDALSLYPWYLGTPGAVATAHWEVLWRVVMRSIEIVRDLPLDIPLVALVRPSQKPEEALWSRLGRVDLASDDDLMEVAATRRPDIKRAKDARLRAMRDGGGRERGGGRGDGRGGAGGGGGDRGGRGGHGGRGGCGGRGGQGDVGRGGRGGGGGAGQGAPGSGSRPGLRSGGPVAREQPAAESETEGYIEETNSVGSPPGMIPGFRAILGSPRSFPSGSSRASSNTDPSTSSGGSRRM